jgi:hypothetical protein
MSRYNSDSFDNFSPEEFPFLSSHHLSSIDSIETIDTTLSLTPPRSYTLSNTSPRSYTLSNTPPREGININYQTSMSQNNLLLSVESYASLSSVSSNSVESICFSHYDGSLTNTIVLPLDEDNFYHNINQRQGHRTRTRRNAIISISPSILANLNFN